jgi:hypothetical protein
VAPNARGLSGTPATTIVEHEHASLDPMVKVKEYAYEHAQIPLETLKGLGYTIRVDVPENAFEELERIDR